MPWWFNSTSSHLVKFERRVGSQLGSEKIAALACAGRVKTTIFLDTHGWDLLDEFSVRGSNTEMKSPKNPLGSANGSQCIN